MFKQVVIGWTRRCELLSGSPRVFAPSTVTANVLQTREYAARKGFRLKLKKSKVKVEVKKVGFIPHNLREKPGAKSAAVVSKRMNDDHKADAIDDVWASRYFKWKVYDFKEAVRCHRQTHHPEIYNIPNAPLRAFIELDMTGVKKNKYVDSFSRIVAMPHKFDQGEDRSILVFCKTDEQKQEAEAAGATQVCLVDSMKKIERGEIVLPDFQYILAHPSILPELATLRGLLKRKLPTLNKGTLGPDLTELVSKFKSGVQYSAVKDESELDYGWIDATLGTLDMEVDHLEENLRALLDDVMTQRPKREGLFVTRVLLKSEPSVEKLKINLVEYLSDFKKDDYESDSDDEEVAAVKQ